MTVAPVSIAMSRPTIRWCWPTISAALAAAALLARVLAQVNELDWDMFHEMALFRAALQQGWIPSQEIFAYTPTVNPSVHHEWATGMVLYTVAMRWGLPGVLALKYVIIAAIIGLVASCARLRGASWRLILTFAPIAILLGHVGLVTIRAQLFTVLFTAALLLLIEYDKRGVRWWLIPWMLVHIAWLNLHAGFVVGAGFLAIHWIEQVIRTRKPHWHLIAAGVAMTCLVFVNPYGVDYVRYLFHGLTMPRPLIHEWQGIHTNPALLGGYVASMLLLACAIMHVGWRRMQGLAIVLVLAYLALRHQRHASLYAVAWMCYVPAWLRRTPIEELLELHWTRRRVEITTAFASIAVACVFATKVDDLLHVRIPTHPRQVAAGSAVYPAGAVEYLRDQNFRGNVMTPFEAGSYVMWHLWPNVKVGLDSRYEVAYQPGVAERIMAMYDGSPGWRETLEAYPTEVILIANTDPLLQLLANETSWQRVYCDDAYALFARPGVKLPFVDHAHEPLNVRFP